MKKAALILLPIAALIFEILPFGAVLIFAPSATERVKQTFSYFDPITFGYANFAPPITAALTCLILIISIAVAISENRIAAKMLFVVCIIAAIISAMPLLLGLEYLTVTGGIITLALILECVLSRAFIK